MELHHVTTENLPKDVLALCLLTRFSSHSVSLGHRINGYVFAHFGALSNVLYHALQKVCVNLTLVYDIYQILDTEARAINSERS